MYKSFLVYIFLVPFTLVYSQNFTNNCFPCFCSKETILNCEKTSLRFLPNNHSTVQILEFSHNGVVRLNHESFQNLSNLLILNISYNLINEVPNKIFTNINLLKTLDLSGNAFKSIYKYSFAGLFSLERLLLNNLKYLTNIESGAFGELFNLKYLNIANNKKLISLSDSLKPLSNLEYLDISNNSLTSVKFNSLNILKKAKLSNNKWICDCNFKSQLTSLKTSSTNITIEILNKSLNSKMRRKKIYKLKKILYLPPYNSSIPTHKNFLCSSPIQHKHKPVLVVFQLENCFNRVVRSTDNSNEDTNYIINNNLLGNKLNPSSESKINTNYNGSNNLLKRIKNDNHTNDQNFTLYGTYDKELTLFKHKLKIIDFNNNYSLEVSNVNSQKMECVWTMQNLDHKHFLLYNGIQNNTTFDSTSFGFEQSDQTNDTLRIDYVVTNESMLILIDTSKHYLGYYNYFCLIGENVTKGGYELKHRFQLMKMLELTSFITGCISAFFFLLISFIFGSIRWCCTKCSAKEKQKNSNIKEVINTMKSAKFKTYREAGLEKITAFGKITYDQLCAFRLARVKNIRTYKQSTVNSVLSCLDQLRETYTTKTDKITSNCQSQYDRLKLNYAAQKLKFSDNKSVQMDKIRKNYSQQAGRIKEYSTQQLVRLREQYKTQQHNLLHLLELMEIKTCLKDIKDDCSRTESAIFESELTTPEIHIDALFPENIGEDFDMMDEHQYDTDRDIPDIEDIDMSEIISENESESEGAPIKIDFEWDEDFFRKTQKNLKLIMKKNKKLNLNDGGLEEFGDKKVSNKNDVEKEDTDKEEGKNKSDAKGIYKKGINFENTKQRRLEMRKLKQEKRREEERMKKEEKLLNEKIVKKEKKLKKLIKEKEKKNINKVSQDVNVMKRKKLMVKDKNTKSKEIQNLIESTENMPMSRVENLEKSLNNEVLDTSNNNINSQKIESSIEKVL